MKYIVSLVIGIPPKGVNMFVVLNENNIPLVETKARLFTLLLKHLGIDYNIKF